MTTDNRCGTCGENTVVSGACAACGAGVKYRKPIRFGPKKIREHSHEWDYDGVTFESGTRQRRDKCAKCPAVRLVDLE